MRVYVKKRNQVTTKLTRKVFSIVSAWRRLQQRSYTQNILSSIRLSYLQVYAIDASKRQQSLRERHLQQYLFREGYNRVRERGWYSRANVSMLCRFTQWSQPSDNKVDTEGIHNNICWEMAATEFVYTKDTLFHTSLSFAGLRNEANEATTKFTQKVFR